MKVHRMITLVALAFLWGTILTGCRQTGESPPGPAVIVDEGAPLPGEVPAAYRDMKNPFPDDPGARRRGEEAFGALCSQCHGAEGAGDGSAGLGLKPPPADLADAEKIPNLSDGYLYWRIAEGGGFAPFDSQMPAWGTLLSDIEIWELVTYIRSLTP